MRWVRGYPWWQRVLAGCSNKSQMQSDWDDLTQTQRLLVCKLYNERDNADFSGAAVDLGWELGSMMRFLEKHC
jgi:hypothetical protein